MENRDPHHPQEQRLGMEEEEVKEEEEEQEEEEQQEVEEEEENVQGMTLFSEFEEVHRDGH